MMESDSWIGNSVGFVSDHRELEVTCSDCFAGKASTCFEGGFSNSGPEIGERDTGVLKHFPIMGGHYCSFNLLFLLYNLADRDKYN
jgi:hypothetical protein